MKTENIRADELNEEYLSIKHNSGLQIMFFPKRGFSKSYAVFAAKYGSIDNVFKTSEDQSEITVPEGIAHFLEHKLFEGEKGNAMVRFAKTGASPNAFTSFDKTAYLFSCTDKFYESLEILLDFVQSPYFTEESVKKEQGIIEQEISMYNDDADWRVFFNLLKAAYVAHPVRVDIAGSTQTIAEITPDLLYKCYNTFYNLSQMVLCICGDLSLEEIIKIADKALKPSKPVEVERKYPEETEKIAQKRITQKLHISVPLYNIGIKDNIKELNGYEYAKRKAATDILLEMIIGESSNLYVSLYEKGLVNLNFSADFLLSESFGIAAIGGESHNPDEVYTELFKEIERIKKEGLNEKDFERCKKTIYGRMLRRFNGVENLANDLIICYFIKAGLFDFIKAYKEIDLAYANERLNTFFKEENSVISIIEAS